jgi:cysteine-rich repeat protein
MKITIAIASFLVVGAGAAGAAAIVSPYQGSDTLFQVTTAAISAAGITPANAYVGGGSGNAASAMSGSTSPFLAANSTQQTGPMSRMMKSEAHVCGAISFNNGVNGSNDTSASGIVVGLDAVGLWSAVAAGGATTCNGTADGQTAGLAFSGSSSTIFTGGTGGQNWKWILALLYGGKDFSNSSAAVDCGSAARRALVANWSNLFQNSCANGSSACAASGPTGGALWHAFRRDDTSGTSDVFATILGLSPGTSNSSNNGFGASPYCNAINWDSSTANANCTLGANNQFTGPGGIDDPASTTTPKHRRPPVGTWGDAPDPGQGALGADVLPTQFQDNDPIRRPCLGGATNVHARPGEEVCNLDGALGVVIPMPDSDWMLQLSPALKQYPVNNCNTFAFGKAANVFTCALRGTKHSGECPNGDALIAGGCLVPIDSVTNTSQCVATKATVAALQSRSLGSPDGRIYNVQMRDGTTTEPTIGYAQYNIASIGKTVDFVGGYSRIHQVETVFGNTGPNQACQLVDMTDQIGCLAQADTCSIGYAGAGAATFSMRTNPGAGTAQAIDSMRVAKVAPSTATVQALGTKTPGTTGPEYQVARKLYFVSLPGFNNIAATSGDGQAADELKLAQFEATPSSMNPIILANGFFTLGSASPAGLDTQFCEDFNEQMVCNPTPASASTLAANINGCTNNPTGIPTVGTTCGNGTREAYEECDDGPANGTTGDHCSQTCRCTADFNNSTGVCN